MLLGLLWRTRFDFVIVIICYEIHDLEPSGGVLANWGGGGEGGGGWEGWLLLIIGKDGVLQSQVDESINFSYLSMFSYIKIF